MILIRLFLFQAFSIIDEEEFKKEANLYSILFVAIGIVNGLAMFTQVCFEVFFPCFIKFDFKLF